VRLPPWKQHSWYRSVLYNSSICHTYSSIETVCSDTQVLADTCENLHKAGLKDQFYQPVRTYVLNPKSITMGELYGEVNKLTLEWRDGLMAMTVRKAVQVRLWRRRWWWWIIIIMMNVKQDALRRPTMHRYASVAGERTCISDRDLWSRHL